MQPGSARSRFWQWFQANGERLRAVVYGPEEAEREAASAELREAVEAAEPAEPGLVLEFGGPLELKPRQLIVSADGKPERVDAVKDFVASAPALPGWQLVAFRPRMDTDGFVIDLQGERVGPDDVWFRVADGDAGLALTLYVRGLTRANERTRGLGASLLAEHTVGERDVLTMLGSFDVKPLPKAPDASGLRPLRELAGVFDEAKANKYPPPGSLPIDPESDWQNMQGTIDGSLALVLLHAGLAPVAGHPDYDRRLVVSVPFHEARDDGMPASEEEFVAVADLGDRLADLLREGQESLLALTITTQGRRDLVFYTADAEAALRRIKAFRADSRTHPVEAAVERDTFWGMYRSFLRAGAPDESEE